MPEVEGDKVRDFDDVKPVEAFTELVRKFGARRSTELLGYIMLFGMSGFKTGSEMRAHLEEKGLSKSGMYRALADIREFAEEMEKRPGWNASPVDFMRKLFGMATQGGPT